MICKHYQTLQESCDRLYISKEQDQIVRTTRLVRLSLVLSTKKREQFYELVYIIVSKLAPKLSLNDFGSLLSTTINRLWHPFSTTYCNINQLGLENGTIFKLVGYLL